MHRDMHQTASSQQQQLQLYFTLCNISCADLLLFRHLDLPVFCRFVFAVVDVENEVVDDGGKHTTEEWSNPVNLWKRWKNIFQFHSYKVLSSIMTMEGEFTLIIANGVCISLFTLQNLLNGEKRLKWSTLAEDEIDKQYDA